MTFMVNDLPSATAEVKEELQWYWSLRDDITVIDQTTVRGRRIIILAYLQKLALEQLHINHMGIEKTRLLACNSVYWINITVTLKMQLKTVCLDFQLTHPKDKMIHCEITEETSHGKLWCIYFCIKWQTIFMYCSLPQQISSRKQMAGFSATNDLFRIQDAK